MSDPIELITTYIGVSAALGTASFALVDATKAVRGGGISSSGFSKVAGVVEPFFSDADKADKTNPLGFPLLLETLKANWLNGTALGDQKAIAKSLLKLRLNTSTATHYASVTTVNQQSLVDIVDNIAKGVPLSLEQGDAWARFDLILTAILDQGYERADQIYRNRAKALSVVVSVVLAIFGFRMQDHTFDSIGLALLVGLVATPIAPIAKDLTSALAAGVKVAETFRK